MHANGRSSVSRSNAVLVLVWWHYFCSCSSWCDQSDQGYPRGTHHHQGYQGHPRGTHHHQSYQGYWRWTLHNQGDKGHWGWPHHHQSHQGHHRWIFLLQLRECQWIVIIYCLKNSWLLSFPGPKYSVSSGNIDLEGRSNKFMFEKRNWRTWMIKLVWFVIWNIVKYCIITLLNNIIHYFIYVFVVLFFMLMVYIS